MDDLEGLGRLLLIAAAVLGALGLILLLAPNIPFIGRLPGDIRIESGNVRIYIPLGRMSRVKPGDFLNLLSRR